MLGSPITASLLLELLFVILLASVGATSGDDSGGGRSEEVSPEHCEKALEQCAEDVTSLSSLRASIRRHIALNDGDDDNSAELMTPSESPAPAKPLPTIPEATSGSGEWITGTWTTGYWDCCKPSCAWPGKGNVDQPVKSCDATTGEALPDGNVDSVCQGGTAAACTDQQPWVYSANLSMGFAAAAVDGQDGLVGDADCGECFELRFISRVHSDGDWGGADRELVGKRMVVQVTNIGYDVTGNHSFDLQIPGAGQGEFSDGCEAQFAGYSSGDFDCDTRYGGCDSKKGCARLPEELRGGCEWRYDWLHWLEHDGKTNNPYIEFRRVRCPKQLTSISGSVPSDDDEFPAVDLDG